MLPDDNPSSPNVSTSDVASLPQRIKQQLVELLPPFVEVVVESVDPTRPEIRVILSNSRFANKALLERQVQPLLQNLSIDYTLVWVD